MILDVVKYPDPRLGLKAEPITEITAEIRQLAQDMLETMYHEEGIGLAAPQVGHALRLIVMDPMQKDGIRSPRVIVNPELELAGEIIVSEREGCLSVPLNYRADVPRYSEAHLKGQNLDGSPINEKLDGLPAIVVQHEVDHLDGRLFIDRISRLRRNMYDTKVKKWQKAGA